ncbi:hypothetical protein Sta7437_1211 [Stanieria cyanosphaera PCC 7437]|uniref:DUF3611 family protein n=1 Tax=Stanieria cyanosphaera (strain ATCC 29371 / PCC 7437) TaxID=111780 RepID=K9XRU9_STAC7|nr:DUF3611 family protein [Stanieria cyanosphaera]AFZ34781.1 hypothetical protein Sta7437_1211 [Stanieria cyanosphaera PCC 7437]
MNRDSELSAYSSAPSNKIQKVSNNLKQLGRIGFWLQIVLGVVSTVLLLVAAASVFGNKEKTPGIELGIFCAFCGVILLAVGIFFSFRYIQIANKMQSADPARRPKKADTLTIIRYGLIVNLVGMLLSILGAEALSGIVLLKVITVPQSIGINVDPNRLVNAADLLIVQANTNTIAAHFTGIVTSLILLNRITK